MVESFGVSSEMIEIESDLEVDALSYQLIFLGAPVHFNLAPKPVMNFLQKFRSRAANQPSAPEIPGHYAAVFCTYGGGHTGTAEALPLLKFMGQMLEHEGIRVVEEWPVVGDFPSINDPFYNTAGRMGNILGRPHKADLKDLGGQVTGLLRRLQIKLRIEDKMELKRGM